MKNQNLTICIFCDNPNESNSVEHIVSESLGNTRYVMKHGEVCDDCNRQFSKFEGPALTNSVFIMERSRHAVKNKKGKTAKGRLGGMEISGDDSFRENLIYIQNLQENRVSDFDPENGTFKITVPAFDKSDVAASKLVLKIGLESIYTSKRTIFERYDFTDLKNYLTTKDNKDWPFLNADFESKHFNNVLGIVETLFMRKTPCELKFYAKDNQTLLFKFKYGGIPITINLINRSLDWIENSVVPIDKDTLYPEHYRNKLKHVAKE